MRFFYAIQPKASLLLVLSILFSVILCSCAGGNTTTTTTTEQTTIMETEEPTEPETIPTETETKPETKPETESKTEALPNNYVGTVMKVDSNYLILVENVIRIQEIDSPTYYNSSMKINTSKASSYKVGDYVEISYYDSNDIYKYDDVKVWETNINDQKIIGEVGYNLKKFTIKKIHPKNTTPKAYGMICEINSDSFIYTETYVDESTAISLYKVNSKIDNNYKVGDFIEITYKSLSYVKDKYETNHTVMIFDKNYHDNPKLWSGKIGGKLVIGKIYGEYTALSVAPSTKETYLEHNQNVETGKPVIYLYPTTEQKINVKLNYMGALVHTFPVYPKNGWTVTAKPNGTLYDKNGEYPYLFWDGKDNMACDFSKGFCIKGSDSENFLQKTLAQIGLNDSESAEFIDYWLPVMQCNKYNIISFQDKAYTDCVKLDVTPKPDKELRIFMAFKASEKPIDIAPQTFSGFNRTGYTLVEWGAKEVK